MTAFLTAMGSGISAKKILEFLIRKSPDLSSKISKALASGISAEKIIQFFSKDQNFEKLKSSMEQEYPMENNANPLVQGENIRSKNLAPDMASGLQRQAPGLIGAGVGLGAGMALKHALPNLLKGSISEISQKNQEIPQQPPVPNVSPNISQPAQIQQPKVISNPKEYLEKLGVKDQVDSMLASKNTPEAIAATLGMKKNGMAKIDPELLENVDAYAKTAQQGEVKTGMELTQPEEERKPISKKELVSSSKGVGTVKEIRGDVALIDVDGNMHKVDVDELETEPPDIAELYDNLFNAIPDQFKSRMMNYAGYDEDANELLFRPHGGAAYVYKNIPQEFAEILKNRLHRAKTTGKNMYGMWHEGDASYGAGMSALIKELQAQYGGKGKEYVRKYNTLFDILGVPHEEKKRKEEEKRRKRKGIS